MQGAAQETAGSYRTPESVILRVAFYSLAVNAGLVVAKLGLSVYSGSLALRADGIHSFVDVVASIALIAGVYLSSRKRRDFPYGLYKVENVVAVAIALLIFFTAFEIAAEAVTGDAAAQPYSGWVLLAVAAFIPVPYVLGTYEVRVGEIQLPEPDRGREAAPGGCPLLLDRLLRAPRAVLRHTPGPGCSRRRRRLHRPVGLGDLKR